MSTPNETPRPMIESPEIARPWEPLNGRPVRVGDEVKRTQRGVTRSAVVGRVGLGGGMWTDEGCFIGHRDEGTWYVRSHDITPDAWKADDR